MLKLLRLFGAALALVAGAALGRPVEDAPVPAKEAPEEPTGAAPFMRRIEEPGRSMASADSELMGILPVAEGSPLHHRGNGTSEGRASPWRRAASRKALNCFRRWGGGLA